MLFLFPKKIRLLKESKTRGPLGGVRRAARLLHLRQLFTGICVRYDKWRDSLQKMLKQQLHSQNNVAELIPLIAKYGGTSVSNESSAIAISTDEERKQIYAMTFNIRRLAKTAHDASKNTLAWMRTKAENSTSTETTSSSENATSTENTASITSFDDYQRISPLCDQAAVALVLPRDTSAAVRMAVFDLNSGMF